MARLHEHQGKAVLAAAGIKVPRGRVVRSASQAVEAAREIGLPVMVKVQAWTTGRAAAGGIAKAKSAEDAGASASRMLALRFGRFPVEELLVEETISIKREFFLSLAIDERERAPVLLLSATGGSGVESRADQTRRIPCDVIQGPNHAALNAALDAIDLPLRARPEFERVVRRVFEIARQRDARSVEINPLVLTESGEVVAADCRITIDDYAVARHPELGIEIARELDHPPTALERLAYRIEQEDHRGTFFFAQMNQAAPEGSRGLIGFHGAGGGGSMMSMDAISAEGFTPANFCDTSGNPSPAKVYRAARIILSQPGLVGYFGSGSGVANQEQFWSAYGLAKAFWELQLSVPAVIRLGGNAEDRAVDILHSACAGLPARVEGFKKTDPPARIAARFAALVAEHQRDHPALASWPAGNPRVPEFVASPGAVSFDVRGGRVCIDPHAWKRHAPAIIARSGGTLRDHDGRPEPALPLPDFAAKDSELIACEVECRRDGIDGLFVCLDIPGLDEAKPGKAGL